MLGEDLDREGRITLESSVDMTTTVFILPGTLFEPVSS
jgi:hypothetical protein